MPEELRFENEEEQVINEVTYRRTIKGIPSLVTTFFIKNLSENISFKGKLNSVPTYGRSYSEDLAISDTGQTWGRTVDFDIGPLDRAEFKARVIPFTTPPGVSGRASLTITGEWY